MEINATPTDHGQLNFVPACVSQAKRISGIDHQTDISRFETCPSTRWVVREILKESHGVKHLQAAAFQLFPDQTGTKPSTKQNLGKSLPYL